eukprot:NODE_19463_length_842_cov_5.524476.p1 GENE.NODE_19463_length_842_cov_5.524476~~NODE_19463_length_842_cov_5.524476.p1  ORF type:complete len:157 (-),score=34.62 NODE_19463_length_842_cov_5.524476:372-788(-)
MAADQGCDTDPVCSSCTDGGRGPTAEANPRSQDAAHGADGAAVPPRRRVAGGGAGGFTRALGEVTPDRKLELTPLGHIVKACATLLLFIAMFEAANFLFLDRRSSDTAPADPFATHPELRAMMDDSDDWNAGAWKQGL